MNREELIKFIVQVLKDEDSHSALVNFLDDEVDWNTITSIVLSVLASKYGRMPWELQ
jgi:hypothetical protein